MGEESNRNSSPLPTPPFIISPKMTTPIIPLPNSNYNTSTSVTFPLSPITLPTTTTLRIGTLNIGRGFLKKNNELQLRFLNLSLDIIALQEINDPPINNYKFINYILITSPGITTNEVGVGLLLNIIYIPKIRLYKKSKTGRLVGVMKKVSLY